ncbi:hypothetical protein A2673_00870 [Candidatus Kaiserbacteria bacterium RIFCSPHIGHO2_01_FULL_50_13]|uniref:Nudix hydrolase domain-containing protein n=1 Tax=Candidatus Kaiserbacteria bacterium RIFCSPLOWO2_01_FULL_50_24 TaxID=1798507 RepID=A0A1F6EMV9_9BACT|nr:MAG: hypothetical protein A2673_00870 [Candidatus Kaiserbacteria bacterium RIFCSPHIGHO2_01_FULL_50_13]OGG74970.1 MAG: hypothetical protein A3A34_04095 [Candidatus Kaiserbacteria bacterium RIFCSPLOWO2_01_FULL_50_24]OGG81772.1 MAG: hypothetical protein A3H74_01170 [Candidatus Kaiserbacteria bacterium RIFCSPLOWO2_02_FULL_51_13]
MGVFLPPNEFYKTLPKKPISSGAIIFDEHGKLLLVKAHYKKHWSLPGGLVDADESPHDACKREVLEEAGLTLKKLSLLCVHYVPKDDSFGDRIQFTFFGGEVMPEEQRKVKCGEDEIEECRFVSQEEAIELSGGPETRASKRLYTSLDVLKNALGAVYLEAGEKRE